MDWDRKRYKNGKVWVAIDDDGNMLVSNGLVKGRYKKDDTRDYSFKADAIRNLDGSVPPQIPAHLSGGPPHPAHGGAPPIGAVKKPGGGVAVGHHPQDPRPLIAEHLTLPKDTLPVEDLGAASKDYIEIHTDGATSGNPGPSGLGVVLRWGPHYREIRQYIGQGTNNIAELTAIKVALEAIKKRAMPVRVYTDSQYSLGVLTGQYRAKANRALIVEIQHLMAHFPDLQLRKIKGHAGEPLNERADELARLAVSEVCGADPQND